MPIRKMFAKGDEIARLFDKLSITGKVNKIAPKLTRRESDIHLTHSFMTAPKRLFATKNLFEWSFKIRGVENFNIPKLAKNDMIAEVSVAAWGSKRSNNDIAKNRFVILSLFFLSGRAQRDIKLIITALVTDGEKSRRIR